MPRCSNAKGLDTQGLDTQGLNTQGLNASEHLRVELLRLLYAIGVNSFLTNSTKAIDFLERIFYKYFWAQRAAWVRSRRPNPLKIRLI